MDPITAIGAVASIVQLAQGALSLSKTLYSLGAAIATASDDIQVLADDLKTFSQSLTLLSRLLEDSKSWYSDDIYLLTAKVIKDCAELYVKIDKLLVKLGGNGKSTWKLRIKFVYKEGQIRKLMNRLRDMKGTLATILMSLQVDLQLSLLNISSSSKIQRTPEKPLQRGTIQTLMEAQKAAQESGFLSTFAIRSEQVVHSSEKGFGFLTTQYEEFNLVAPSTDLGLLPNSSSGPAKDRLTTSSREWTQASASQTNPRIFNALSTESKSRVPKEFEVNPPRDSHNSNIELFPSINLMAQHQIGNMNAFIKTSSADCDISRSLKSVSSFDSFQSAVSVIQSAVDVPQEVEAVRNVLHAFRTSLEVLEQLMEKRLRNKEQHLYSSAKILEGSLTDGEKEISATHISCSKLHGSLYSQGFTDSHITELQTVSSMLMSDVVMALHTYSAPHVNIQRSDFKALHACSERCKVQAICQLSEVASKLQQPHHEIEFGSDSSSVNSEVAAVSPIRPSIEHATMSLPFVGYTFKRFDKLNSDFNHSETRGGSGHESIRPSSDQSSESTNQSEVNREGRQTSCDIRTVNGERAEALPPTRSRLSPPRPPPPKRGLDVINEGKHASSFNWDSESPRRVAQKEGLHERQSRGRPIRENVTKIVTYKSRISPAVTPSGIKLPRKERHSMRSVNTNTSSTNIDTPVLAGQIQDPPTPMAATPITPSYPKRSESGEGTLSGQHDPPHAAFAEDNYSINSYSFPKYEGPSAIIGPRQSIHGNTVPVPDWTSQSLGLKPSIVDATLQWDDSPQYHELPSSFGGSVVPCSIADPSILQPSYPDGSAAGASNDTPPILTTHPTSSAPSHMSRGPRPNKAGGQLPPLGLEYNSFTYSRDNFSGDESGEEGLCPYPECGKVFKDMKAHLLTHQNDPSHKCPIQTCDYHIKGFTRKYDKNRHILTHFKGTMVCGFCPGSGSEAEKSFTRADIFKRHLTSIHGAEQKVLNIPENSPYHTRRSSQSLIEVTCSTCLDIFRNAQEFYDHVDDCVLLVLQKESEDNFEDTVQTEHTRIPLDTQNLVLHDAKHNSTIFDTTGFDRRHFMPPSLSQHLSGYSQELALAAPVSAAVVNEPLRELNKHRGQKPHTNTQLNNLVVRPKTNQEAYPLLVSQENFALQPASHQSVNSPRSETGKLSELDVLQDFDFDSFLHQDGDGGGGGFDLHAESPNFNLALDIELGTERRLQSGQQYHSMEEVPEYVNSKQFYRILKRRITRQKLDETLGAKRLKRGGGSPAIHSASIARPRGLLDGVLTADEPLAAEYERRDAKTDMGEDSLVTESPEPSSREDQATPYLNLSPGSSTGGSDKETTKPNVPPTARHRRGRPAFTDDISASQQNLAVFLEDETMGSSAPESDGQSSRPSMHPCATSQQDNLLSTPLASDQFKKLWWQAYCSLSFSQPKIYECLNTELGNQFGALDSKTSDQNLARSVESLVEKIRAKEYGDKPGLRSLMEYRTNIIKVVTTISSQLGLEMPAMGWCCVGVFLAIYEYVLETLNLRLTSAHIKTMTNSFQQLQDIVGLIARYAVMENLYHQSPSLTMTTQYQDGLLDLSVTILQYFAHAFTIARGIERLEEETGETVVKCGELVVKIKEKDKVCQGFRVVVEAKDGNDNESEDSGIEDVSDESLGNVG